MQKQHCSYLMIVHFVMLMTYSLLIVLNPFLQRKIFYDIDDEYFSAYNVPSNMLHTTPMVIRLNKNLIFNTNYQILDLHRFVNANEIIMSSVFLCVIVLLREVTFKKVLIIYACWIPKIITNVQCTHSCTQNL